MEGQEVADKWKATLISNNGQELSGQLHILGSMILIHSFAAGFAVEFLHKCWFCRFTSWQAQNLSDDQLTEHRDKRLVRALPNK